MADGSVVLIVANGSVVQIVADGSVVQIVSQWVSCTGCEPVGQLYRLSAKLPNTGAAVTEWL